MSIGLLCFVRIVNFKVNFLQTIQNPSDFIEPKSSTVVLLVQFLCHIGKLRKYLSTEQTKAVIHAYVT